MILCRNNLLKFLVIAICLLYIATVMSVHILLFDDRNRDNTFSSFGLESNCGVTETDDSFTNWNHHDTNCQCKGRIYLSSSLLLACARLAPKLVYSFSRPHQRSETETLTLNATYVFAASFYPILYLTNSFSI